MTNTIVIGVEPATAERVAWIGGELASLLDARAVLVHVQRDARLAGSTGDRERARHGRDRRGREIVERAAMAIPPELELEKRVAVGDVASGLARVAEEEGAQLIVVGSRGRGRVAATLFGSVSQALAKTAPCPVTIMPPSPLGRVRPFDGIAGDPATMVAGMDGSGAGSSAARVAKTLATSMGHRLVVVQLRDHGRSGARALQAICASEDARMIVVAAGGGTTGLPRGGRSLATRLPRLATCPVTVVPAPATAALVD